MRALLTASLLLVSTSALANPTLQVPVIQAVDSEILDLSCDAQEGILLAGPAVVASIAARQAELSSCASGEFATVSWTWSDGQAEVSVDKASSESVSDCVQTAIVAQAAEIEGSCTAKVALGSPAQASAAR